MSRARFGSFANLGQSILSPQVKIQQAIDELKKRGVKNDHCPRCNTFDWNVDLLEIPANSALSVTGLPTFPGGGTSGYLSLLVVVCKKCGNTIFHNLEVLGIPIRP